MVGCPLIFSRDKKYPTRSEVETKFQGISDHPQIYFLLETIDYSTIVFAGNNSSA